MTLNELSAQATAVGKFTFDRFAIVPDLAFFRCKPSEELCEELTAELKRPHLSRGSDTPMAESQVPLADDLADLFDFLLQFAESRGIDLGAALTAKWGRSLIAENGA